MYNLAKTVLTETFVKAVNEVFARHLLATRRQKPGETLDIYFHALHALAKDCNFTNVTAAEFKNQSIRDAFITGIQSSTIRQRLLENTTLTLADMVKQARALDSAQKNAENYSSPVPQVNAMVDEIPPETVLLNAISSHNQKLNTPKTSTSKTNYTSQKCWYCGNKRHRRFNCPAKDTYCPKCGIKGHYGEVCLSKCQNENTTASLHLPTLACITSITAPLSSEIHV